MKGIWNFRVCTEKKNTHLPKSLCNLNWDGFEVENFSVSFHCLLEELGVGKSGTDLAWVSSYRQLKIFLNSASSATLWSSHPDMNKGATCSGKVSSRHKGKTSRGPVHSTTWVSRVKGTGSLQTIFCCMIAKKHWGNSLGFFINSTCFRNGNYIRIMTGNKAVPVLQLFQPWWHTAVATLTLELRVRKIYPCPYITLHK